jgi:hypothetical protein
VSVQYRLAVANKDERIDGPDDADIVITAPVAIVTAEGFDATVEYMRGKVKASGHAGELLELLKSGEVDATLTRLASQL